MTPTAAAAILVQMRKLVCSAEELSASDPYFHRQGVNYIGAGEFCLDDTFTTDQLLAIAAWAHDRTAVVAAVTRLREEA